MSAETSEGQTGALIWRYGLRNRSIVGRKQMHAFTYLLAILKPLYCCILHILLLLACSSMLCVHIKVGMAIEPKKLAFLRTETAYYRTSLVYNNILCHAGRKYRMFIQRCVLIIEVHLVVGQRSSEKISVARVSHDFCQNIQTQEQLQNIGIALHTQLVFS